MNKTKNITKKSNVHSYLLFDDGSTVRLTSKWEEIEALNEWYTTQIEVMK